MRERKQFVACRLATGATNVTTDDQGTDVAWWWDGTSWREWRRNVQRPPVQDGVAQATQRPLKIFASDPLLGRTFGNRARIDVANEVPRRDQSAAASR